MTDIDTRAAGAFYREVRKFVENAKGYSTNVVFYDVKPDEYWDLSLVSKRVYGRRCEVLAVMASAGLDTPYQGLPQKRIILPNDDMLYYLKRKTGFESEDMYRANGKATWDDLETIK